MGFGSYFQKTSLLTENYTLFILPLTLVFLSYFGMQYLNQTNNNSVLLILYFLLAIYLIILIIKDKKLTDTHYCIILYLIGIALIQLFAFRSNHILGRDSHLEFLIFQNVLNSQHIIQISFGPLDACLSISVLPALVQLITNISPELLFKILFPFIFSLAPIIVFLISRNFLDARYSFLSALFFISLQYFIRTAALARINIAILFFLLGMYVIFKNERSNSLKFLSILFICSVVFSHYSTAYIVLGILVFSYVMIKIIKKFSLDKNWENLSSLKTNFVIISFFVVFIYITVLFLWYGLMLSNPLDSGLHMITRSIDTFDTFFLLESRDTLIIQAITLPTEQYAGLYNPLFVKFVLNWLIYILIVVGIIGTLLTPSKICKKFFLKNCILPDRTMFTIEYIVVSIIGLTFFAISIALPLVSTAYDIARTLFVSMGLLSPFFIVGSVILFNILKFIPEKITSKNNLTATHNVNRQTLTQIFIVIIIIANIFSNVGIVDYFANKPDILLNSQGSEFRANYLYDQENLMAKWLGNYRSPSMLIVYFRSFYGFWIDGQAGKLVLDRTNYGSAQLFNDRTANKNYEDYYFLLHGFELEQHDFKKLVRDTNKIYQGGNEAMVYL